MRSTVYSGSNVPNYWYAETLQSEGRIFDGNGDLTDSSFSYEDLFKTSLSVPGAYDEQHSVISTAMQRTKMAVNGSIFFASGATNADGSYYKKRVATDIQNLPPPLIPLNETLSFAFGYDRSANPGAWIFEFNQQKSWGPTINYAAAGDFFTMGNIFPDPNQTGTALGCERIMQLMTANEHYNDQQYHFDTVTTVHGFPFSETELRSFMP
jgi:hypothetical protein